MPKLGCRRGCPERDRRRHTENCSRFGSDVPRAWGRKKLNHPLHRHLSSGRRDIALSTLFTPLPRLTRKRPSVQGRTSRRGNPSPGNSVRQCDTSARLPSRWSTTVRGSRSDSPRLRRSRRSSARRKRVPKPLRKAARSDQAVASQHHSDKPTVCTTTTGPSRLWCRVYRVSSVSVCSYRNSPREDSESCVCRVVEYVF
jgi:hypothetical protein